MDKKEFRNILFRTAVFAMACDGEIHETEIQELESIAKNTPYFEGTEQGSLLAELVEKIKKQGRSTVKEYFELISGGEFTPSEELLILEVALRIIQADKKIDQNEERFMRALRRCLLVSDEILKLRFGSIEYLMLTKDGAFEEMRELMPENVLSLLDGIQISSAEVKERKEKKS